MSSILSFFSILEAHSMLLGVLAFTLLAAYTLYLDHKIVVLTRGKNALSLEEVIHDCLKSTTTIEERNELLSKHILTLEEKVSHALRNAQTLRYKAFDTNGSNQSFSIALVNEKGNGAIISSLHAHERISTFAKPIEHYTSTYDLTDEEKHVLEEAKKAHKVTIG